MEKTPITAEQMRHYDSYTINQIGIPSLVLMERAALAVRDEILNAFPLYLDHVVVVAGSGNNGGDGLDVARLLHIAGVKVTILNVGNPDHASEEHQVQEKICQYYQIPETTDLGVLKQATLIVDAMFGIELTDPLPVPTPMPSLLSTPVTPWWSPLTCHPGSTPIPVRSWERRSRPMPR